MLKLDDYTITTETKEELVKRALKIVKSSKRPHLLLTINAHSFVESKKDKLFHDALKSADILIPDGASISIASKVFNIKPILKHRVPGPDFFEAFNKVADQYKLTYFFMGSSDAVLEKIKARLGKEHPNIKVYTHSPPFYPFEKTVNDNIIETINNAKPDVLWVGMTAPKQEKWSYENKDRLKVPLICPIGAAFDFYAGTLKRAPNWMQNAHLEWAYRFMKEPKRTYKRYIHSNVKFLYHMIKLKAKR